MIQDNNNNTYSLMSSIKTIYKNSHIVQSKMDRYSCCNGLIGSEAYSMEDATHKLIRGIATELKLDSILGYLRDFRNKDFLQDADDYFHFDRESYESKKAIICYDADLHQYKYVHRDEMKHYTKVLSQHKITIPQSGYNPSGIIELDTTVITFPKMKELNDIDINIKKKLFNYNTMLIMMQNYVYNMAIVEI
jgi:hypothetical protein